MPVPKNIPVDPEFLVEGDWTQDLPHCPLSKIATATNQIYQSNGFKKDDHPFYETGFNFSQEEFSLYGLFSGQHSATCAKYVTSAIPAELFFEDIISSHHTAEQIRRTLSDIWFTVDKQFLNSLEDLVAEQITIEIQAEDLGGQYTSYSDTSRASFINQEVKSTASGILGVLCKDKFILSYIGDNVGILVHEQENARVSTCTDGWRVSVLTCGHNRENEDEKLRLGDQAFLDLQIANVRQTRFLGNYHLKKQIPEKLLVADDLILNVEKNWKFIVLASPGVFEALSHLRPDCQEVSELAQILVRLIGEHFEQNAERPHNGDRLNRVTQNVIEEIVRLHFQAFSEQKDFPKKRPDMTLLIRLFDESLIEARAPLTRSSNRSTTLDSTSSLLYPGTHSSYSGDTSVGAYVDFSKFLERASADSTFPREWLEIGLPEPASTGELSTQEEQPDKNGNTDEEVF